MTRSTPVTVGKQRFLGWITITVFFLALLTTSVAPGFAKHRCGKKPKTIIKKSEIDLNLLNEATQNKIIGLKIARGDEVHKITDTMIANEDLLNWWTCTWATQHGISASEALNLVLEIHAAVKNSSVPDSLDKRKRVLLMDSALLPYIEKYRQEGRTNAHDISEILGGRDDLLVSMNPTFPGWNDQEQVRKLDPDLVVIHLSGFYDKTTPADEQNRFVSFLRYMSGTKAKFLIYTRSAGLNGSAYKATREQFVQDLRQQVQRDLRGKLFLFNFPEGAQQNFRDTRVVKVLRDQVLELLGLDAAETGG